MKAKVNIYAFNLDLNVVRVGASLMNTDRVDSLTCDVTIRALKHRQRAGKPTGPFKPAVVFLPVPAEHRPKGPPRGHLPL